jgi:murein DD-endopeptidase MepM/ murein hydrolase activator NlpD
MSSGFGMRRHPVLGFSRKHEGVDFAAPRGTPVHAAADGIVASMRVERGYGRILRLRHQSGVETRYAHLARFATGLTPGVRVRQGDVIGTVGSSGLATGPHLHYEVVMHGRPVDPARADLPEAARLQGEALASFQAQRRALQRQIAQLEQGRTEVALAD